VGEDVQGIGQMGGDSRSDLGRNARAFYSLVRDWLMRSMVSAAAANTVLPLPG
jgi:hypothetical protein